MNPTDRASGRNNKSIKKSDESKDYCSMACIDRERAMGEFDGSTRKVPYPRREYQ